MLTLITGVPGAGKTLYALNLVKARADKEQRAVYVDGVADLKLGWFPLDDATKWAECPDGAIILIDEAQRVFRPRGTGAQVPEHVAQLETHRHKGIDIVLVTQHPMLIDSNIRRLVGQHFHVIRRFGGQKAVIHEWSACTELSRGSIAEAVRHDFMYPRESFAWYKSAELHTHKRRIPMRVFFMWAAPLLIAGLLYAGWLQVQHWIERSRAEEKAKAVETVPVLQKTKAPANAPGKQEPMTAEEYRKQYIPRLKGLSYTAPVYDEATKVVRAPVPTSCVASKSKCVCYSQDATYLAVPDELCRAIVEKGFFTNFDVAPSQTLQGHGAPPSPSASPNVAPVPGGPPAVSVPAAAVGGAGKPANVPTDKRPPSRGA